MELNFVIAILDRDKGSKLNKIYNEFNLPIVLAMLGRGTATRQYLDRYGLEETEKIVVSSVMDGKKTKDVFRSAKRKMMIDVPGNGVMMAIPIKSVGGGKTLAYLTNNAAMEKEVPAMDFTHELIIVILNQGYTDDVMDAARGAGARGGTVVHAKGTGAQYAKKFFGVSLAEEKEIIFIAAESKMKSEIMKSIAGTMGPGTPSGAIAFSLPISAVAGLRSSEFEDDR